MNSYHQYTLEAERVVPKIRCTFNAGPHNKEYRVLGFYVGFPFFGKLSNNCQFLWSLEGATGVYRVEGLGFMETERQKNMDKKWNLEW